MIINRIKNFYWAHFKSDIDYARHIGVTIGNDCFINTRDWGSEPFLIKIGNNVEVTDNVTFRTHGGGHCIRRSVPDFDAFGKITIEDWAYIGSHSIILPGVTIGEGALVAAGSVVTKSVAPNTIVGGNPAKFICTVDEYMARNIKWNLHTKQFSRIDRDAFLKSLSDDKFITK